MPNNPYIEKVKNHPNILIDTDTIYSNKSSWSKFFWDENPLILEIWTWLWNFFSSQIIDNPKKNYLGMEIRYKRLYKTAEKALGNTKNNDNTQNWNQSNVIVWLDQTIQWNNRIKIIDPRVKHEDYNSRDEADNSENEDDGINRDNFVVLKDFWENIDKIFWENELDETYIFFPDPWDKSDKTRKNRMIQESFLTNLYNVTKTGWKLIFKTDHKWYFDFVLDEIKKTSWKIEFKTYDYEKDDLYDKNKITEFEQIFRGQDIKVNYLELSK